ncbi:DUF4214 domain-containing protein [Acidimangrovimonas sediminis]|uniref:DUF4214 domain-containing protein n=1 Tax=Albidovulum sediminis TaxID=3066345 RepID=A0ABT2NG93_9RHOB|nr:DUF4214 domain-containing protein [Defluviimonas sediminis]
MKDDTVSKTKTDPQGRPPSDPKYTGPQPILLDLDGNGVKIDEISRSTTFIDAGGDGLKHRTAWAGAGDGVLFFDADGDGTISQKREYVFTEWDPTATSDMEALRSYFDTNGDGKLTAADAGFAQFRVLVTNADGTKTARSLAELGITEINLTEDATRIVLPDGSVIEGQTTFTKSDGSTGTVASTALVAEAEGHRVTEVVSTDGNGNRVVVSTAYGAGGQVLYAVTSVTSPTGASVTNSWDDDGDGVTDRIQTIDTVTNGDGSKAETIVNKVGALAATAITVSRTVTTRSADGASVVIERDSTGGGWFDQREVQVINADGSRTNTTSDLSQSGSVIRSVSETVAADGRTRATAANEDGLGGADTITTHVITVNGDLSRTEAVSVSNGDATLRSRETTVVSADGKTKTITSDLDGDGDTDLTEAQEITVSGAGSVSTITLTNGDGSLRSKDTHTQSADALTKTVARDVDGDGDNDTSTVDQTVVNADLSRVNTVTVTNVDGSVREKTMVTLGVDKVTSETWVDLDQDGTFQATDLVKSVTVDAGTQLRTAQIWERNADGSVRASEVVTTSADGLDTTRVRDSDGDGDADARIEDVTILAAGIATRTVTVRNQDNSLRTKTETVTSADGLTVISQSDIDGDGSYDASTIDARVLNGDGSTTRTVSDYAGNGTTLTGKATTEQSADRRTVTVTRDADGDGSVDGVTTSIEAADGSQTVTTAAYHANGGLRSQSVSAISANGLIATTEIDLDGDLIYDIVEADSSVLNIDGSRTRTVTLTNGDGSLRSSTVTTTSDDGLVTTVETDADGDGAFETVASSTNVLNANGSVTTTDQVRSQDATLLGQTQRTASDDGLVVTTGVDRDGDASADFTESRSTLLLNDGGVSVTTELRDAADVLRSRSVDTTSDDGRLSTTSTDVNGDGLFDLVTTRTVADDGSVTSVRREQASNGSLQAYAATIISDDGLVVTTVADADGDGGNERSALDTTVLNDDGSTTRTLVNVGANGAVFRATMIATSDDGLSQVRTDDWNHDGTADLTTNSTRSVSSAGIWTETLERRAADNTIIDSYAKVTSADRRAVTESFDADGNGVADRVTTTTIASDGQVTQATERLSTAGVIEATEVATVSGDGLVATIATDRNADGRIDLVRKSVTALGSDGSRTTTVEYTNDHHVLFGRTESHVTDDGLFMTERVDLDGDDIFEFQSEQRTTLAANGDRVISQVTRDAAGLDLSSAEIRQSGNGLQTRSRFDYTGDHDFDRETQRIEAADGSVVETLKFFAAGEELTYQSTTSVSADGRTTTQDTDLDGDGVADRRVVSAIDLDRDHTETWADTRADGSAIAQVAMDLSANGMSEVVTVSVDGAGPADISRETLRTFAADGALIETFSERIGAGTLAYRQVTTTAADGLSRVRSIDADGDGVTDANNTVETTLNADGSRTTADVATYANGNLRWSFETFESADGRLLTRSMDYDGNGLADKTIAIVVNADGSRSETEAAFGLGGQLTERFVTTTSADGLKTSIQRFGIEQTISRSPVDNGSYSWNNGVTAAVGATNVITDHQVDPSGVEIWTIDRTWKTTETREVHDELRTFTVTHTSHVEARLDAVAKALLVSEAARIFDTVLDRELDFSEIELLADYIKDGRLDGAALTTVLLAEGMLGGAEFAARYGTLTDAEFVTQLYWNALGRAPDMAELGSLLGALSGGTLDRGGLVLQLAESSEHLVVGNAHRLTNNFDVILNPVQYERNLDRVFVENLVQSISDVVYDRAPTEHELAFLRDRLLRDVDNPDDVAAALLALDGSILGFPASSLFGLSGNEFVNQAYLNALGRVATSAELSLWSDHISSGRITQAQFVASLAQSLDHLAAGNAHTQAEQGEFTTWAGSAGNDTSSFGAGANTSIPALMYGYAGNDTITGSALGDQIVGGTGVDSLKGEAGSDTYVWARGDGNDTIDDSATSMVETDRLVLTDVLSSDVALTRVQGSNNLIVTITGPGGAETLTVVNRFYSATESRGLEVIEFADGEVWSLSEILAQTKLEGTSANNTLTGTGYADNIHGLGGNDTIDGNNGDDVLIGGQGIDLLRGGTGNDLYVWGQGDGNDTIDDTGASLIEADVLALADTSAGLVSLRRNNGSNDLKIFIDGDGSYESSKGVLYYEYYSGLSQPTVATIPTTGVAGVGRLESMNLAALDAKHGGTGNYYAFRMFGTLDLVAAGDYTFNIQSDDGWSLLIDGVPVSNTTAYQWTANTVSLSAGQHTIEFAYFEAAGADYFNMTVSGPDTGGATVDLFASGLLGHAEDATHLMNISPGDYAAELAGQNEISVSNQFANTADGKGIEVIEFADGEVWSLSEILARTKVEGTSANNTLTGTGYADNIYGLAGNDTISGGAGDDVIVGGTGVDALWGGDVNANPETNGNDSYLWSKGDGGDTINDWAKSMVEQDTLVLLDVVSTEVSLTYSNANGDDLLITVIPTNETITIDERFKHNYTGYGIEAISFADGVIWTLDDLIARTRLNGDASANTLAGSGYADNIYGFGGNDTIDGNDGDDRIFGGAGADLLRGDNGNDLYAWSRGDGNDTIDETSTSLTDVDTLRLIDVNATGATLTKSGSDLIVSVNATSEVLTVKNRFASAGSGYGVEYIEFADGVVVEVLDSPVAEAIVTGTLAANTLTGWGYRDTIYGLDGNDTISAGAGDDALFGGTGVDSLKGEAGSDTYVWARGDGNDTIDDSATSMVETDRLVLTDVLSSDVTLTRAQGSNNLIVTITGPGGAETLTVVNRFYSATESRGLEVIEFADGEVWSLSEILAQTKLEGTSANNTLTGTGYADNIHGLGGNDTISGGAGDDALFGGTGVDSLKGEAGSDTYVWARGDGNDTIDDSATSMVETDRLVLTDVLSSDVALTRAQGSNNLIVTITGPVGAETLTVVNRFYSATEGRGLEVIEFADGEVWSLSEILARTKLEGTSANNTLTGTGYADNIHGLGGNDTIDGNNGDDVLIGGQGIDLLRGGTGNDLYVWGQGDGNDTITDAGVSLVEADELSLHGVAESQVSLFRDSGSTDLKVVVNGNGSYESSKGVLYYEYYSGLSQPTVATIPTTGAAGVGRLESMNLAALDAKHGGNGDNYAVRMFGTLDLAAAGDYTFNIQSDDGWALLIDGVPVSNTTAYQWTANTVSLSAGQHTIELAYFESVSVAYFNMTVSGPDTGGANADLFASGLLGHADDAKHLMNVSPVTYATDLAGQSTLVVTSQFASTSDGKGIEQIGFADGTNWSLSEILARTKVEGTSANNTLTGTGYADNIYGLAGNDTISGGAGDDVIVGGTGADTLKGEAGGDTYVWARGDGNDTIDDSATSMVETDRLVLTDVLSSDVTLTRAQGSNNLIVTIAGLSGAETLTVVNRFYSTSQGRGLEVIEFADGEVWSLSEILAQTKLEGTSANNTLTGTGYADNIYGLAGNDTISGGAGDDVLVGGAGADSLAGGGGEDTVSYITASQGVSVSLATSGAQTGIAGGDEVGDVLTDIDHIEGSLFGDVLVGDAWSNTLSGLDGNDSLRGGNGSDTLVGGTGADSFIFAAGDDQDIIRDFQDGTDLIRFEVAGLTFADLVLDEVAGSAVVRYGDGDIVVLEGVTLPQLSADDFIFV